jgi:hypothetical protein
MAIDAGQMIAVVAASVVLPWIGSRMRLSGCLVMPLAIILSVVIGHLAILVRYPDPHFGPVYSVAIGMYLLISSILVAFTYAFVGFTEDAQRVKAERNRVEPDGD